MPSGDHMDSHQNMTGDARWLTYGQLASVRRISRGSAVRLARRMKWTRQAGNDGFARVLVPVAWQEPAGDRTRDNPDDTTEEGPRDSDASVAFQAALIALREAHAGEVAALIGRVNVAESFAAELRGRVDDLQGKLTDVQGELAAAMDRADQSAAELQAAQIALGEAQADVAEVRQAEEARKGRGLAARLRAALRGE